MKTTLFYTRYVDVFLYNESLLNASELTSVFHGVQSKLMFMPSHEMNQQISFLDLLITYNAAPLEINIFRKTASEDKLYTTYPTMPWKEKSLLTATSCVAQTLSLLAPHKSTENGRTLSKQ